MPSNDLFLEIYDKTNKNDYIKIQDLMEKEKEINLRIKNINKKIKNTQNTELMLNKLKREEIITEIEKYEIIYNVLELKLKFYKSDDFIKYTSKNINKKEKKCRYLLKINKIIEYILFKTDKKAYEKAYKKLESISSRY